MKANIHCRNPISDHSHSGFGHERLEVYKRSIEFVVWSEEFLMRISGTFAAKDHLRRAADGIPLNIADANSKRSQSLRAQLLGVALGSTLECAACLDIAVAKRACTNCNVPHGKQILWEMVRMLVKLRQTDLKRQELHEEQPLYGAPKFSHEKLYVYRAALRYVLWSHLLCQVHEVPAPVSAKLDVASTSIILNLAEGNGRFPAKERCRFLDLSQSAALRCASTLDIWAARNQLDQTIIRRGKRRLERIVAMSFGLKRSIRLKESKMEM